MDELDVSLMRGTLDLLILKALSWGPRHGYSVVEWIEQATDAEFMIGEGTLYPALHRLERRGLITSEWGVSENNRQAKYYSLAKAGRARLQARPAAHHADRTNRRRRRRADGARGHDRDAGRDLVPD